MNERYFQSVLNRFPDHSRVALMVARLDILRGHDSAAMARARQVLERNPKDQEAQYFIAELATVTDAPDAMSFVEPLVREAPEGRGDLLGESYRTQLGRLFARRGEQSKADSLWSESAALSRQRLASGDENPALAMELAGISAMRGDTAAALASLEQSYRMGWKDARITAIDPFLASLRRTPRYRKVLAQMSADMEAMRRTAATAHPELFGVTR